MTASPLRRRVFGQRLPRTLLGRIRCRMSLLALLQIGCLGAFAILLIAAGLQGLRPPQIRNSPSLPRVARHSAWATARFARGRPSPRMLGLTIVSGLRLFARRRPAL